jgi:CDP-diacylglycerol---glycerol-3-phosphate 3-phosphatidyltransferase
VFDGKFRKPIDKAVKPIGDSLRRTGLTPDHLTIAGLVVGIGAAFAIGAGYLQLGLLLVVLAALPDLLDGALAKASGSASQRGAFFDSVADRVTDALLLGGVAWHLSTVGSGQAVMLPVAVLALSMLISYERAKAEALGFEAKGGLMERAERLIALAVGLLFEFLLIPVLWVMLALSAVTVVQRFVGVWRQASAEVARPPRPPRPYRRSRNRWKSRRSFRRTDPGAWRRYRERWAESRARWSERERRPRRGPGI